MLTEKNYSTPFFNVVKLQYGKNEWNEYEIGVWLHTSKLERNLFVFWERETYQKVLSKIKRMCESKKYADRGVLGIDSNGLCKDLAEYLNGLKRDKGGYVESL